MRPIRRSYGCVFWLLNVLAVTQTTAVQTRVGNQLESTTHLSSGRRDIKYLINDPFLKPTNAFLGTKSATNKLRENVEHEHQGRFHAGFNQQAAVVDCTLSKAEKSEMLEERERRWVIDDQHLQQLNQDLQSVINCSEEGDTILLDISTTIQPPSRLIIPWDLTISAVVDTTTKQSNDGTFPHDNSVNFSCPNSREGVFLIKSNNVLLANLNFKHCAVRSIEKSGSIIEVADCANQSTRRTIQLQHLKFFSNKLFGPAAVWVDEPDCVNVEMLDVMFTENHCIGICGARLGKENTMTDVVFTDNERTPHRRFDPFMIYLPPASNTKVIGFVAYNNKGAVFLVRSAVLDMTRSEFFENTGDLLVDDDLFSSCLHAIESSITISSSAFHHNNGDLGGALFLNASQATVMGTAFEGNRARRGGVIYAKAKSDLFIEQSQFFKNRVPMEGGAIYALDSMITGLELEFEKNAATAKGGSIYLSARSTLTLELSVSTLCSASIGGFVALTANSEFTAIECNATSNYADTSGGAIAVMGEAYLYVEDGVFERNDANYAGHIYVSEAFCEVHMSTFVGGTAAIGGGLVVIESNLIMNGVTVIDNHADQDGGALYLVQESEADFNDIKFEGNYAGEEGGAIYMGESDLNAISTEFNNNEAAVKGGALSCARESNVRFNESYFERNNAEAHGAVSVTLKSRAIFGDCTVQENRAAMAGGAFGAKDSNLQLHHCTITKNSAEGGGTIDMLRSHLSIADSILTKGQAVAGGCIRALKLSTLILSNTLFSRCASSFNGGAFLLGECTLIADDIELSSNSAGESGAAMYSIGSDITLRNSTISHNDAFQIAAGIHSQGFGQLNLQDVTFSNNTAGGGSALVIRYKEAIIRSCTFLNNSAKKHGGACLLDGAEAKFTECTFSNCESVRGGAIYADSASNVDLTDSLCERCLADDGACVYGTAQSTCTLHRTRLKENAAKSTGGAMHLFRSSALALESIFHRNVALLKGGAVCVLESNFTCSDSKFTKNKANDSGGACFARDGSSVNISTSRFDENSASRSGAVHLELKSTGDVQRSRFKDNSATICGGVCNAEASTVRFSDSYMTGSRAAIGGMLCAVAAKLSVRHTDFERGIALTSGGCIWMSRSYAELHDVGMSKGTAISKSGGAIYLSGSRLEASELMISQCTSSFHGGAIGGFTLSSLLCTQCSLENNVAGANGGAIHIESDHALQVAVQLDKTTIKGNKATNGGGVHLVSKTVEGVVCADPNPHLRSSFIAMSGTKFINNKATHAGGAIMASDPHSIRLSCKALSETAQQTPFTSKQLKKLSILATLNDLCPDWTGNEAVAYGSIAASYACVVNANIDNESQMTNERITMHPHMIHNQASGSPLPNITLQVVDAFGQEPAIGFMHENVTAMMSSDDEFLTGSVSLLLANSRGKFSGVTGYQRPGFYDITIGFSEALIKPIALRVEVRNCSLGEVKGGDGRFCMSCNTATYNFDPVTGCLPCPDYGNCTTHVIQPTEGYWHRTPCSVKILRCITDTACVFDGRAEKLTQFGEQIDSCDFSKEQLVNYSRNFQCKKGHEGPLCGSCEVDYGKTDRGNCRRCRAVSVSVLLAVLGLLILVFLSVSAIRGNLDLSVSNTKLVRTSNFRISTPTSSYDCQLTPSRTPLIDEITGEEPVFASAPVIVANRTEELLKTAELANCKVSELLKIAIHNWQITSVALSINLEWSGPLTGFFMILEYLSGSAPELSERLVSCITSASASVPRSILNTIIAACTPFAVVAIIILGWVFLKFYHHEDVVYLLRRSLLSAIVVFDISYISVTTTLVGTLNCVRVMEPTDSVANVWLERSVRHWASDTSVTCYEGPHAVLAWGFGLPFGILFSIGFPVWVAIILYRYVRSEKNKGWIYHTAGFLYQSYREQCVFWESVIMIRKAALAIVVVFAYRLGVNLQGVAGVLILTLACYAHMIFRPYRKEFAILNEIEAASLMISLITFVAGLFFNDSRVPHIVRTGITVTVFFVNLMFFLALSILYIKFNLAYFRALLDVDSVDYDPEGSALDLCKVYYAHKFYNITTELQERKQSLLDRMAVGFENIRNRRSN